MWPDWVLNPEPLAIESDTLPTVLVAQLQAKGRVMMKGCVKCTNSPETCKTRDGLNQLIRMGNSTGQKRVKLQPFQHCCSHVMPIEG